MERGRIGRRCRAEDGDVVGETPGLASDADARDRYSIRDVVRGIGVHAARFPDDDGERRSITGSVTMHDGCRNVCTAGSHRHRRRGEVSASKAQRPTREHHLTGHIATGRPGDETVAFTQLRLCSEHVVEDPQGVRRPPSGGRNVTGAHLPCGRVKNPVAVTGARVARSRILDVPRDGLGPGTTEVQIARACSFGALCGVAGVAGAWGVAQASLDAHHQRGLLRLCRVGRVLGHAGRDTRHRAEVVHPAEDRVPEGLARGSGNAALTATRPTRVRLGPAELGLESGDDGRPILGVDPGGPSRLGGRCG